MNRGIGQRIGDYVLVIFIVTVVNLLPVIIATSAPPGGQYPTVYNRDRIAFSFAGR